jgi:hypothetical protein
VLFGYPFAGFGSGSYAGTDWMDGVVVVQCGAVRCGAVRHAVGGGLLGLPGVCVCVEMTASLSFRFRFAFALRGDGDGDGNAIR